MQHYSARASLFYWSFPDSISLIETLFNANISMLFLKLLFSQALSYCRINPELREKCKTTHSLLVWRDATCGKVMPRKAQTWRRNLLIYLSHTSCTPIRTFRLETVCVLKCFVVSWGIKDRFHRRPKSLWTYSPPAQQGLIWEVSQMEGCKAPLQTLAKATFPKG